MSSKIRPKTVWVYPSSNPERDPVRLLKKYVNLLLNTVKCKKLYLRPKKLAGPKVWYCDQSYGVNKVRTAVKEMCRKAGIVGRFTNHSLRATCATRMYENNVPKQIIKETTGHVSDCVRVYKRTSEDLKRNASEKVTGVKVDEDSLDVCTDEAEVKNEKENVVATSDCKPFELSMSKMMENVLKTKLEIRKKLYPKSRLSLRKYRGHKVTIDVNLNVKK